MLHEARDRQKLFSDVQCLRDMQHKANSEYQACLKRQESRKDTSEKKQDQLWNQETSSERSLFSSRSSSKQSSSEEDSLTESKSSARKSETKCDSKLPAIDQTSVKQKHKSTMTPVKSDQAGPNIPSQAAEAPKILSRKKRLNLGRLTVSPEMHSPRASGDTSRQKLQLPEKTPTLWGSEPVVQQEGSLWTGVSKLKRPTRKRRNVISSSQLMSTAETLPARADEGDPKAYSFNEPQTVQRTKSPQELRVSVRPPLIHTTRGGPGRIPLGFQDEDFYSILPQNTEGENYDTEEEACAEEELPLLGVSSPHSPSSQKRSRFLKTTAIQAKDKNCEENAEHCRGNLSRIKPTRGSLRIRTAVKPVTEQSSAGERGFQDPGPPDEKSANENDSGDRENEKKTIFSQDSKSESRQDNDLSAENAPSGSVAMEDKPGGHGYEEDWQDNDSRNSVNCLLSDGPTALQSSVNSSYNSPGSSMHFALRENVPADLPMTPTLGHSLGSQRNSSFSVHRPLSPIRNRNPLANERHGYFPGNNAHEFSIRGTEAIALTSQPQGAPLHADVLLNSQSSSSLVDSSSSSPPRGNLQGHLQVPGFAQENVPFTFFTVSELPNQNENANSMVISSFTDENGATEVKAGSEKLKKLQESLLEEESEEEGDLCRICQIAGGSPANPLLEPCGCVGSLQFVHKECLKKWLKVKITSGADLSTVKTCEMCKQDLLVNLDDFNMTQFYQMHQQFRARNELMNSGFYLVLLLNLYEQRFAELMRLNYRRAIRERLSRNHLQGMLEENESSELEDGSESSVYPSQVI